MKLHTLGRILEYGPGVDRERAAAVIFARLLEHDVVTALLRRQGLLAAVRGMAERLQREGLIEA
jgi:hypothetical protein